MMPASSSLVFASFTIMAEAHSLLADGDPAENGRGEPAIIDDEQHDV